MLHGICRRTPDLKTRSLRLVKPGEGEGLSVLIFKCFEGFARVAKRSNKGTLREGKREAVRDRATNRAGRSSR
ncbi:MAG: hypothetical protein QOG00_1050 [Pyrinomonadaceae bacterium]|nr:hypothetical protein [Pyrinomonadaceae bacterium]